MELRHLKTFQAVADASSFTRAAAELGYVQSAVTTHVKALEEELGVKLFEKGGPSYHYYTCVQRRKLGKICTCTQKSLAVIEAESTVWNFISDLLQDPKKISAGMETLIAQERVTGPQDAAKEAKVWKRKIAECAHKRSAYQDQQAAGLMTLEELGSKLQELDDVRRLAQAEVEALMRRQEHIKQLEEDREALLESMAELVPDDLEDLTPQERNKIYRMLRLEVTPLEEGYQVSGALCSSGLMSP